MSIEIICDKCGKVEADVIEVRESDDAYKEAVCVCSKCNKKHVVKIRL